MNEKKFIIGEKLANVLLRYLGSKPYIEVVELVNVLQTIQPVSEPEKQESYPAEDIA